MDGQYEVLTPWAEVDPIPALGISTRVTDLTDKTIGLFDSTKHAARGILTVVEAKLRERFPNSKFSWFTAGTFYHGDIYEKNKPRFEEWIKSVDTVVLAVGD